MCIRDRDGTTVEGGFLAQGRQAFRNVGRVLEAAGLDFADVIKVGIFVRDMATNLPHVITLRGEFLAEPYPADTLVEVVSLARPDWQIEVEVIALDRSAA
ncbi:RidA family protein, partial [Streptomyces alfalfae]